MSEIWWINIQVTHFHCQTYPIALFQRGHLSTPLIWQHPEWFRMMLIWSITLEPLQTGGYKKKILHDSGCITSLRLPFVEKTGESHVRSSMRAAHQHAAVSHKSSQLLSCRPVSCSSLTERNLGAASGTRKVKRVRRTHKTARVLLGSRRPSWHLKSRPPTHTRTHKQQPTST